MTKRVTCIDCDKTDFIGELGDGWDFVGYDDGAELHRCPACIAATAKTRFVVCFVHHCENCKDESKEAFPYCTYDKENRYWGWLCNECFDELECFYDAWLDPDD